MRTTAPGITSMNASGMRRIDADHFALDSRWVVKKKMPDTPSDST
jgi:hypothetical protein